MTDTTAQSDTDGYYDDESDTDQELDLSFLDDDESE
jgi:hypothetical protein